MKAIQKILKRSKLKIKYSQGFNPHIILSVANPIPVGVCGKNEFADFEIEDNITKEELLKRLNDASPRGILAKDVYINCKKDFNGAYKAVYDIYIKSDNEEKIKDFFEKDVIEVEKKAKGKIKIIDLKEYIYSYDFKKENDDFVIKCELACGNKKNLNPNLIKKAMEDDGIVIDSFLPVRFDVLDEENEDFRR